MLPLSTRTRHGCYLMQRRYMCLGTKETTMEMLEAYAKSTRKQIKKCLKWSRRGATAAGHPAGARTSGATNQKKTKERRKPGDSTAAGHPADPRTSGAPRRAGHPAPARKSGASYPESRRIGQLQPGHPARGP